MVHQLCYNIHHIRSILFPIFSNKSKEVKMKNKIYIIIMILVIGFIIIMQQPAEIKKEGAFHKEASLSACNSYANANDHTCQTSCWQQTQAMNDCMIAYNGESRD